MKTETIDTLSELRQVIDSLPPPQEGFCRVFRGQHTNYGKIISAAHRPSHNKDLNLLWESYCKKITLRLLKNEFQQPDNSVNLEFLQAIKVLSQHYGPGTQYLDMTNSLEIALWFAFNEIKTTPCTIVYGHGEELNKDDQLLICDFLTYHRIDRNAWLYIFDFPIANDVLTRTHGELIDLAILHPSIAKSSKRISVQKGFLVYCDQNIDEGDLTTFLACEPISLSLKVYEKHLAVPTDFIFPSPKEDYWYRHFLKLPFFYDGYNDKGQWVARRLTPIEFYANNVNENDPLFISVKECIHIVNPLLTYPMHSFLDKNLNQKDHDELELATAIILYHSMITDTPSVESGLWHEALLWVNARLAIPPKTNPEPKLRFNFYFEFSPAELDCWDEIDLNGNDNDEVLPRSLWLRHYDNGKTTIKLMIQFIPSQNIEMMTLDIVFDEVSEKIFWISPSNGQHFPIDELGPFCKYTYLVLSLLGDINSEFNRVLPNPICSNRDRDKHIGVYSSKACRLMKSGVKTLEPEKEYYSFFAQDEYIRSFITPRIGTDVAYFIIDSKIPFNEIKAAEIYRQSYNTLTINEALDIFFK